MLNWEWYTDTNVKVVFLHCLLKANYQRKEWKGQIIERGQFVTSIIHLSEELHLTPKQIRGALNKLKMTNNVAIKGANKYSIITICNYDNYQASKEDEGQTKGQANGQSNNQQKGNNKRNKEYKDIADIFEKDNINIISKETEEEPKPKRFVKPTIEQVEAYCKDRRNGIDARSFMDYYESVGWKVGNKPMKDWRAAVRTWERNRKPDKPQPQQTQLTIEDEFSKYGEQAEFMRQYVAKERADKQKEIERYIKRNMDKINKQQNDNNDE